MNPLRLFNSYSAVMSKLRAVALIATGVVAALMQAPVLATNVDFLRYALYVQGVLALVTKFTSVGDQPPTAADGD